MLGSNGFVRDRAIAPPSLTSAGVTKAAVGMIFLTTTVVLPTALPPSSSVTRTFTVATPSSANVQLALLARGVSS